MGLQATLPMQKKAGKGRARIHKRDKPWEKQPALAAIGTARLTPGLSFPRFVPVMPLSYHEELFLLRVPLEKLCVASADRNQEKQYQNTLFLS